VSTADCIFCRIGRGEIPAERLHDDGTVFAIRDINPKAPTHLLVIPHAHVGALSEESAEARAAAAACLAAAGPIAAAAGVGSYRLVANQGADAGQEVPHFHLHILGGQRLGAMG
jgi:histidine triad (HIT) family protein